MLFTGEFPRAGDVFTVGYGRGRGYGDGRFQRPWLWQCFPLLWPVHKGPSPRLDPTATTDVYKMGNGVRVAGRFLAADADGTGRGAAARLEMFILKSDSAPNEVQEPGHIDPASNEAGEATSADAVAPNTFVQLLARVNSLIGWPVGIEVRNEAGDKSGGRMVAMIASGRVTKVVDENNIDRWRLTVMLAGGLSGRGADRHARIPVFGGGRDFGLHQTLADGPEPVVRGAWAGLAEVHVLAKPDASWGFGLSADVSSLWDRTPDTPYWDDGRSGASAHTPARPHASNRRTLFLGLNRGYLDGSRTWSGLRKWPWTGGRYTRERLAHRGGPVYWTSLAEAILKVNRVGYQSAVDSVGTPEELVAAEASEGRIAVPSAHFGGAIIEGELTGWDADWRWGGSRIAMVRYRPPWAYREWWRVTEATETRPGVYDVVLKQFEDLDWTDGVRGAIDARVHPDSYVELAGYVEVPPGAGFQPYQLVGGGMTGMDVLVSGNVPYFVAKAAKAVADKAAADKAAADKAAADKAAADKVLADKDAPRGGG